MNRYTCTSLSNGAETGVALVLEGDDALAALSAAERPRRPGEEPEGFVLVCSDALIGEALRRMGVLVVAIVAEATPAEHDTQRFTLPTLCGLPDARKLVRTGDVVIVDADRGVLIVNPDLLVLTSYQRESPANSPHRLYLDQMNQIVRTLDERPIRVLAWCDTAVETLSALETGCDGVYIGAEGVGAHLDDFPQARRIAERGASRQLVFAPFDTLTDAQIDILVYLSRYCIVTVQTHPSPVHLDLMADRYEQRRVALETELGAFPARDLLLACSPQDMECLEIDHPNLQAFTWDLNTEDDVVHPRAISRILQLSLAAEQRVLRRVMLFPGRAGSLLPLAVGLRATDLVVTPGEVAPTKEAVSFLSAGRCHELAHVLEGGNPQLNELRLQRFNRRLRRDMGRL